MKKLISIPESDRQYSQHSNKNVILFFLVLGAVLSLTDRLPALFIFASALTLPEEKSVELDFLGGLSGDLSINSGDRRFFLEAIKEGHFGVVADAIDDNLSYLDLKTKTTMSSPLHIAAEHGHGDMVSLLLEAGHSPSCLDIYGKSPYDRAKKESIKRQLVASRLDELKTDYPFENILVVNKKNIQKTFNLNIEIHDSFPAELSYSRKRDGTNAVTLYFPSNVVQKSKKNVHIMIDQVFKKSALMSPVLGELTYAQERENALNIVNYGKLTKGTGVEQLYSASFGETIGYLKTVDIASKKFPWIFNSDNKDSWKNDLAEKFKKTKIGGVLKFLGTVSPKEMKLLKKADGWAVFSVYMEENGIMKNGVAKYVLVEEPSR
ncbi:hypothetical protein HOG98_08865 [bacterium]|jgi:hypothetical protein|nr:hypothetical protein [bacterium]